MRIIGVSVLALALMASLTVAMTSQQATNPEDTAVVVGLVTRAGTNEPLTDVQVSLEGAVSEETMQRLLRETANAGIAINPPPGASLSETTQLLISTAAARGLPIQAPGIQNLVTRAVGEQKWPTTTTDRDGKFTFTGVKPGRFTVRAQREGFFGKPVNGTYPPTAWTDIVV